jgi:hypothetical protein
VSADVATESGGYGKGAENSLILSTQYTISRGIFTDQPPVKMGSSKTTFSTRHYVSLWIEDWALRRSVYSVNIMHSFPSINYMSYIMHLSWGSNNMNTRIAGR